MDWTTNAEAAVDAACRRARGSAGLLSNVLDELHTLLALRISALYRHDSTYMPVVLHGSGLASFADVDPELMHPGNDPCHRIVEHLTARPRVVDASGSVPRDVLRDSPAYGHFYRLHGVDHVTCLWLDGRRPPEPGINGMTLMRGDDAGAFGPAQFELLRNTLPVLTLALQRSGVPSPYERWIALGPGGDVLHWSPAAEEFLRRLGMGPSELSQRLWGHIDRWRKLRTQHPYAGQSAAIFHIVERRRGTIYVEVTENARDVRLRLLDRHHVPRLADLRERHGLTAGEVAVLQALALGLSNTEAADYLCVSTETVKSHVRRALSKLGLASRLQAGLLMQRIVLTIS
jgi:DNA-binding CsgD family transcriptional regulator